uniref:Acyl-CoA-binding domain-containing protein 5-like n=1 Tax=Callorhinus ursinus TaxID=34884 RepID=A0A3Q7NRY3_CALUR|nr:acyl-CoA-binding domain-containing protein 5-like [Callorhinus ursinus]
MLFLSFHAGSWESCCCCCLIPADRPWAREWGRRWRLEMADPRSVHETRFEAAVKVIQSLPKNGKCAGSRLQKPTPEAGGPGF